VNCPMQKFAMRSVLWSCALLAVSVCGACAEDLQTIGTFPCANDGTCPPPFKCTASHQCVSSESCKTVNDCSTDAGADSSSDGVCPAPEGGGVCDVYPECGCPVGMKCARPGGGAGKETCLTNGSTPPNSACQSDSDCANGYVCNDGLCLQLCQTDQDCGQPNWHCRSMVLRGVQLGYNCCLAHCNPLMPFTSDLAHVACGTGQSCWASTNDRTQCIEVSGGGAPPNAACQGPADCDPGTGCWNLVCRSYCTASSNNCGPGKACVLATPALYDGTTQLGFCM
jgi:hypothetical protein